MKLSDLNITYPSSLTDTERKYVFECFKNDYPDEVEEWIGIERGKIDKGQDALDNISNLFRKYIFEKTNCTSTMATSSLFMDMRSIIHLQ